MGKCTWTVAQEGYLREHYATGDLAEMSEHIGKSIKSIQVRASSLGLRREIYGCFTEQEKEFIRANASKLSTYKIAQTIKRGERAVKEFMFKNGIAQCGKFVNFKCESPDSCFNCPHEDCVASVCGFTAKENQFLNIGMQKTVGQGNGRRRV